MADGVGEAPRPVRTVSECCAPRRRYGWVAPVIGLAVIPKCPLCLVTYAAWLGLGVSFSVAAAVRVALIAACLAALAWTALAAWRRR